MAGRTRILVIGKGVSGRAAAGFLQRQGAEVFLYNSDEVLSQEIKSSIQKVVVSPGVSLETALVVDFKRRGIPVIGEIELAYGAERGRVIAITGTNGKTTTTTLVGEIMKAHMGEAKTIIAGNIGVPYTEVVERSAPNTVTVAEVSSFQLEATDTFAPSVSAILNVSPDHLDRHHTMDAYISAKEAVFKNQTENDFCVLNYDNEYTARMAESCPAQVIYFSSGQELWNGYFLRGNEIVMSRDGVITRLLDVRGDMKLKGICNVENVMAAIAIADAMKVPRETALQVIRSFRAVEHRIEYVDTINGVEYYNDSKATNPDSAVWGIRAMDRPVILIAGGYDKKNEYDEWIKNFEGKVNWLVLMGQTREKIAECAKKHGFHNIRLADTWEECFQMAEVLAKNGDAVLLSPACASFGMFENYEERGRCFKTFVKSLSVKQDHA